jgi:hypothetical protein
MSFNTILNKIEETDDEYNREKFLEKKVKSKPALVYSDVNMNEGDFMKKRKYENREVKTQKFRLSKKQRRLQEGENTLASFLTKEDKQSLFLIEEKVSKKHKIKKEETKQNNNNLTEKVDLKTTINNNNEIVVKGLRKKRINKYKKAIYRYRYQKKKFILDNVMKLEENKQEGAGNINTVISKDIQGEEEKKMSVDEIKQTINLNQETNVKPTPSTQSHDVLNVNGSTVNNTKYTNNNSINKNNAYSNHIPQINKYNYNNMYIPSYSNYMYPYYYPMQQHSNYSYPSYMNYYNNFTQPLISFYNPNETNYNNPFYATKTDNFNQKPNIPHLTQCHNNKRPYTSFFNKEEIPNNKHTSFKESSNNPSFNGNNAFSNTPSYCGPHIANYQNTTFQKAHKKRKKKAFKPNKADLINPHCIIGTNLGKDIKQPFLFEQKLNEKY